MIMLDWMVTGREMLLARLLGCHRDEVLNAAAPDAGQDGGAKIATSLKQAMNALMSAGIDAEGHNVDDARLRTSDTYAALGGKAAILFGAEAVEGRPGTFCSFAQNRLL